MDTMFVIWFHTTILVFMELTLQYEVCHFLNTLCVDYNPCFYGINFAIYDVQDNIVVLDKLQSLFLWN